MSAREWSVYVLRDPRTGDARYVGWSFAPARRLQAHINDAKRGARGHKANWIRGLLARSERPSVEIAESGSGCHATAERRWIRELRESGAQLTNATDGGDGTPGLIPTAETRQRMAAAHRGRKMSPEAIAKTSAALRGRPKSAEHRATMSRTRRGKMPTAACAAARRAVLGKKQSAAHVEKRVSAHRGIAKPALRKLDDEAVRVIRSGFYTYEAMVERFGVAAGTIDAIKNRRRYADVPDWAPDDVLKLFSPHCLPLEQQRGLFDARETA